MTSPSDSQANEERVVRPRTACAHTAFVAHFKREPSADRGESCWLAGYVAALEDLPDEMLSALDQLKDAK